ncbi:MAG: hypothetical protein R3A45_03435 [Bdellovibrionota bacterium]
MHDSTERLKTTGLKVGAGGSMIYTYQTHIKRIFMAVILLYTGATITFAKQPKNYHRRDMKCSFDAQKKGASLRCEDRHSMYQITFSDHHHHIDWKTPTELSLACKMMFTKDDHSQANLILAMDDLIRNRKFHLNYETTELGISSKSEDQSLVFYCWFQDGERIIPVKSQINIGLARTVFLDQKLLQAGQTKWKILFSDLTEDRSLATPLQNDGFNGKVFLELPLVEEGHPNVRLYQKNGHTLVIKERSNRRVVC